MLQARTAFLLNRLWKRTDLMHGMIAPNCARTGRPKTRLSLLVLAVALFSGVVVWKGWAIFFDSFERGRTTGSLLNLPSWVAELAVPFGFALLFVQALVEVVRLVRGEITLSDKVPNE